MTIKQIIAAIIAKEGGYVNHPADKGGPTNYGITAMSYSEYFKCHLDAVTVDMIKAIPATLAEKIYYTLYYVRPNIISLPPLIQPIMLDMAVNHGRRGSVKILQKALIANGYSFSKPDGLIGEKTIAAAEKAVTQLGKIFIDNLVDYRINYYNEIIEKDPTQAAFRNGWIARAESFRPAVA
jgi:lysozyme family protein